MLLLGVSSASSGQAGAVDEELFLQSFEDVKPITFISPRSVQVRPMSRICPHGSSWFYQGQEWCFII